MGVDHRVECGACVVDAVRLPAEVNRLEPGHDAEPNDCAILSLAIYLGVPYPDIIRIAARVIDHGGKQGLPLATIKQIAALCDAPLRLRRAFDPDDDYGIVWVEWRKRLEAHSAVLRNGLVLDRNAVWEWATWIAHQGRRHPNLCKPVLLVAKE